MGSSVAVFSAYRLVRAAKENGAQIVIINVGETRADALTDIKVIDWTCSPFKVHPWIVSSD